MWHKLIRNSRRVFSGFLNLIFPPVCILCEQKYIAEEISVCKNCLNELSYLPEEVFKKKEIATNLNNFHITFLFDRQYQKMIHFLKYKGYKSLGLEIGKMMAENINTKKYTFTDSSVIPIPLHPVKYRERGYNQAELIAQGFAKVMGLNVNTKVLQRIKNTRSQTKLTKEERIKNMTGAFKLSKNNFSKNNIILIDDVYTTGTTMNSAAETLKSAGVENIIGIASAAPAS